MNQEVLVAMRVVGLIGMHDETAEHPRHLLHRHMRVVEVCALLVNVKFVNEASAGLHLGLANAWHSIIGDRVFKAVPVQ